MSNFINVGNFRNVFNSDELILPYVCKRYWVEVNLNKVVLSPFMKYEMGQRIIDPNKIKTIKKLYRDCEVGSVLTYSVEFLNAQDREAFAKRGIKIKGKYKKISSDYWVLEED